MPKIYNIYRAVESVGILELDPLEARHAHVDVWLGWVYVFVLVCLVLVVLGTVCNWKISMEKSKT